MIPERKKTPEEIAALREGLGVTAPVAQPEPAPVSPPAAAQESPLPSKPDTDAPEPNTTAQAEDPVVHLDMPSLPVTKPDPQSHRLRKHDLPLAPAPPTTQKTAIPAHRHDPRDIEQIRKREALAKLQMPGADPAAHLRKQTAHPVLYIPGYLLAIAAGAVAYQRVHHITPIALLALSLAITLFIAIRKPRSRHHAALIFILIFLTAVFGGLHYAPLFHHGP